MFSCRTMGLGGALPPAGVWDAGTGPTTIGMRTDAGIVGNGAADGAPELGGDACGNEVAWIVGGLVCADGGGAAGAGVAWSGGAGDGTEGMISSVFTDEGEGAAGAGVVEEDAEGKVVVLKARGVEVNGGGNGAPLESPLTLLLSGGSRGTTAFVFFPPTLPSFPP